MITAVAFVLLGSTNNLPSVQNIAPAHPSITHPVFI